MNKLTCQSIICVLFLGLGSCSDQPEAPVPRPPSSVTAFQVEPRTIPAVFEFVGVAKSSHPVQIRARVEGYLWSVDYVEGSAVKVGDPLFQLDPRPFEASLEEAVGVLEREEAVLWRAKKSLDRIAALFPKNAVSQRDLDDATAAVMAAEASVLSARANVDQAKLNLSFTKIESPINGLTARSIYQQGTLISPNVNGLLTEVSVIDPIWVVFSISDNDLLRGKGEKADNRLVLPKTQEYTVQLQLSDGSFFPYKGQVNFTAPTLDPATGALAVRAAFPNPDGMVLPGQFIKAYVLGAYRPDAIIVPQKSVSQGRDGMYVFVVGKDGTVSLRNVEVGEWYKEYWIIKAGLQPGEVVVVEGTNKLGDGSAVKVTSVSLPPTPKIPQESLP